MSNFWLRAITGFVFVSVIVCSLLFKAWIAQIVFGFVAIVGLNEFYALFNGSKSAPQKTLGVIFGLLIYFSAILLLYTDKAMPYLIGFSLFLFPFLAFAELYRKKKTPFENIAIAVLGIVYLVIPMILLGYTLKFDSNTGTVLNFWPVLTIFILVWCSDTFAYLVGRQIGKTKLFERISPKKSWEGFFGGFIFSIIGGLLIAHFTGQPYIQYAVYGMIISAIGTIGDLIESMLKRSLGVKDSGTILPGHGGILDRFDAVLFITPIIYFLNHFVFIEVL